MMYLAKRLACCGLFSVSFHDVSPLRRFAFDLPAVRHGTHSDQGANSHCLDGRSRVGW